MRRLVALAVGGFFSVTLISAPHAAPADTPAGPQHAQGLKNSKKVMQSLQDRQKKAREVKKRAHAKRQQAQGDKQLP